MIFFLFIHRRQWKYFLILGSGPTNDPVGFPVAFLYVWTLRLAGKVGILVAKNLYKEAKVNKIIE